MASGIYLIENIVNGKVYVGSAVDFNERFRVHNYYLSKGSHHSQKLQYAWNKYGEKSFVFKILEVIENVTTLLEREQYWLDEYNCVKTGYNICPVAGSCLGIKRSDETKSRLRNSKIGHEVSEEVRQKISEKLKGIPRPDISEKLKGNIPWNKGKPQSEEQKRAHSERMKGRVAWNKGKRLSDEHVNNLKLSHTSDSYKGKNRKKDFGGRFV